MLRAGLEIRSATACSSDTGNVKETGRNLSEDPRFLVLLFLDLVSNISPLSHQKKQRASLVYAYFHTKKTFSLKGTVSQEG